MSRICSNIGDSGKLRFYGLDHESKMLLLKTHSHTSIGLAMEPGRREEKRLEETQTLKQGNPPIEHLSRIADVAGGGGAEKPLRQTDHRKGIMTRQTCVERKGNTGASTSEKSCQKPRKLLVYRHPKHLQHHIRPWR